jgi:uncharacterized protein (DUF427 family)
VSDVTESVWDYPRPPRLEVCAKHLLVRHGGQVLADSRRSWRVLETSHPPVYYLPRGDVAAGVLEPSAKRSYCEYKGEAAYWHLRVGDALLRDAAWSYQQPSAEYAPIAGALAFYPSRFDECTVDGEPVTPQPGDFYGGWITADIVGPFKGGAGTVGW